MQFTLHLHTVRMQSPCGGTEDVPVYICQLLAYMRQHAHIACSHTLVLTLVTQSNYTQCAREALVGGTEDVPVYICQLLVDMLEQPAPLIQPHLPAIVAFCMEVALAKQLELTTREQALQVVAWAARCVRAPLFLLACF